MRLLLLKSRQFSCISYKHEFLQIFSIRQLPSFFHFFNLLSSWRTVCGRLCLLHFPEYIHCERWRDGPGDENDPAGISNAIGANWRRDRIEEGIDTVTILESIFFSA